MGLVRAKNAVDIMAKNLSVFALGSVVFMWLGFHVMYGSSALVKALLPSIRFALGGDHRAFITIHGGLGFLIWQLLLSIVPLSIFIGITAERFRIWPLLIFTFFWCVGIN